MKTISKRLLCILLSVFLLLAALPLTVSAESTLYQVGTSQEIQDAAAAINNAGAGEYVIELTADITSTTGGISFSGEGTVVTIIGNGYTFTSTSGQNVQAWNGAKVILGDGESELTLIGSMSEYDNSYPGIFYIVDPNSVGIMNDKVTLKNNITNNHLGAGVSVQSSTFIMNGGTIENCGVNGGSVCYGGGVAVFNGGYFEMNDGTIKNCYVESVGSDNGWQVPWVAGGGVFVCRADFTMNGGSIEGCTASNYEDSDIFDAFGGGVAVVTSDEAYFDNNRNFGYLDSNFTMNGGTIKNCSADVTGGALAVGAAYVSISPLCTQYYGVLSGSNNPGIFLNRGTMTGNDATDGGAIFLNWIRPSIPVNIKNMLIDSNSAEEGGAIDIFSYWTQARIEGCTITNNTAESSGGAIMLDGNGSSNGTFLKDTTITGNTSGDRGAGVYYDANSRLNISGADVIQDNTYNGKLNNLNVLGVDYPVYVNGDLTGSQIGLSDPDLWDDDLEDTDPDAASADHLTSGYRTYNPVVHPDQYFTSDHETWYVDRSQKITTTEPDTSSAYRVYTFERHPVESIGSYLSNQNAYFAPYAGNVGQYEISEIQKPELKNKSGLTQEEIIEELAYRYSDTDKYSFKDDSSTYVNDHVKYTYTPKADTSLASSPLSSIVLEKKHNENDKVTLSYNAKARMDNQIRSGSVTYTASASNQPYPGKLLLQITSNGTNYLNDTYYRFSDDYTEKAVEYVDADLPTTGVLYEYDKETGDIVAKLIPIIDPSTQKSYVTEYAKTITTESGTDDEVRLNRKETVDYHINNEDIASASYDDDDLFTQYVNELVHTVSIGDTIEEFYLIPQHDTEYIFKGWYYDPENDDDDRPVQFGTDKYIKGKDIYAHWIKVEDVEKDEEDENSFTAEGVTKYGGFDLAGVQIRKKVVDSNFDYAWKPGGMRFVTSLSTDVVEQINAIRPNNIEYGYVAATNEGWIGYHQDKGHKLQYISKTANGIDTSETATDDNYFDFASNINCTSRQTNTSGVVYEDHRNYRDYLLYTLVITYENVDDTGYDREVLARPYIHYTDANNLERVAYSEYRGGSNTLGGCYTSYNDVA